MEKPRKKPPHRRKFLTWIQGVRPPLVPSCLGAVLFSAASLGLIALPQQSLMPEAIQYAIFLLAALGLFLSVWALVPRWKDGIPLQKASRAARQNPLLASLLDDRALRTLWLGWGSLLFNGLLALSKLVAGWWFASKWFMVLAGYYLVLCLSKGLILSQSSRSIGRPSRARTQRAWRIYRTCGLLLVALSLSLLGVAVLIVREGQGFVYRGNLIFVVALFDFYSLTSALVYLIRNRKRHSPAIVAIKCLNFASSLVSMLSLQTAMFASFGGEMAPADQQRMNALTGAAVCVLLATLGIGMVVQASRRLHT